MRIDQHMNFNNLQLSRDRESYEQAFDQIQDYLKAGDILSGQFYPKKLLLILKGRLRHFMLDLEMRRQFSMRLTLKVMK